jgi:hypothetical protein
MVRYGTAPFLDCSSNGDRRFSPAHARIRERSNRSIEDIYRSVREYRGRLIGLPVYRAKALVEVHRQEVKELYAKLWDEYIAENPRLLEVLCAAAGIVDPGASPDQPSAAHELWRIRAEILRG